MTTPAVDAIVRAVATTSYATCPLCEAICGIAVEHDGDRILSVRGDAKDPFSRGYICPKAVALQDIHDDPDRIRHPMRRVGDRWEEIGWDDAIALAGKRLAEIQEEHGNDAVAFYIGNPTAHTYSGMLYALMLLKVLGTRNFYSSNSVDGLPRLLVSTLMYGSPALIPIPDIDRTDYLLVLGANPVVSNGSIMTAPDCRRRITDIRERGGKVVVIDPRRTETADLADRHHFIRPGTDAMLLLSMVHVLFRDGLCRHGTLTSIVEGKSRVQTLSAAFSPSRVAPWVGMREDEIVTLAHEFAAAKSAAAYGRMGTCTQEFGAVTTWLLDVLNTLTGNLDREGGAMFTSPAVDLASGLAKSGQVGFARWTSRVRGLPELNGEFPVAALLDELETPGKGQIRALITHAGNPVSSLPNGRRLDRALSQLDFMVSLDIYLNETTRRAHLILPTTFGLEHDHYPLLFHAVAVRNTAKYSLPVIEPARGVRHDWAIMLDLAAKVLRHRLPLGAVAESVFRAGGRKFGPREFLKLSLRFGPAKLSLEKLQASRHGVDLGPLVPRLPRALLTHDRCIQLAPPALVADLDRLEARLRDGNSSTANGHGLLLIGRRTLRSNNSWMHNSTRLTRGRNRCTLLMHPDDAAKRGVESGARVRVTSRVGSLEAELEISDEVMAGVVSLPHGFGQNVEGVRLSVAGGLQGTSVNDITDDRLIDAVSGASSVNGVPVEVSAT